MLNGRTVVEGSCCAIKRGFLQSEREGDDMNVIFQVGRLQVFRSRKSTQWIQNFEGGKYVYKM
jgi:hypothetical protein